MSAEASQRQPQAGSSGRPPTLGERYEILSEARLPGLDSPHAQAYQVRDWKASGEPNYALVCERELLPRIDLLERFARIESEHIVKPLLWGNVEWPQSRGRRYAIVMSRPGGERVVKAGAGPLAPMRLDEVQRKVILPLMPVFGELTNRVLTHRSIRTDNLFYADEARSEVVLGECVSAPPGLDQDVIYETIENGMANAVGRGPGCPEDDLYAFGVLLAVLIVGGNPCQGMADHEVVAAKLKVGSYGALLGRAHVPPKLMEPLRGLLSDDVRERWTARDLWLWTEGRQLTPKQPILPVKAARPIRFGGQDYHDTRSLAHAMANNWSEAERLLGDDRIIDWVRRSLNDVVAAELLANTIRGTHFGYAEDSGSDSTISRVIALLDPLAPIRYRGYAVNVEALGQALAVEYHRTERVQLFVEVMRAGLALSWFERQPSLRPEFIPLKNAIELAGTYLVQTRPGYGIERCLYQLAPAWPCQSPLFERDHIYDLKDLLPAYERLAQDGPQIAEPVDGHVAAFCAANLKHLPERILNNLGHEDRTERTLAMLRLLSEVQRRTGPTQLPALSRWFADLLGSIIEVYHNRPYRERLAIEVQRTVERGALAELGLLLGNDTSRSADEQGYANARAHYFHAAAQVKWLEQGGLTGRPNVMRVSRQVASVVSALVSGVMFVVITLIYAI